MTAIADMRKTIKVIFSIAIIVFLHGVSRVPADAQYSVVLHNSYDTLDPLPLWYPYRLAEDACTRACCGPQFVDRFGLLGTPLIMEGEVKDTCRIDCCDKIYLLAWLRRECQDSALLLTALYSDRTALVLVSGHNDLGQEKYVIVVLSSSYIKRYASDTVYTSDTFAQLDRWQLGSPKLMKEFDSMPSNTDIYRLLKDEERSYGGFFTYDVTTWKTKWRGSEVLFIDGDVREKTWEAVIGEKPTKFFPNGK